MMLTSIVLTSGTDFMMDKRGIAEGDIKRLREGKEGLWVIVEREPTDATSEEGILASFSVLIEREFSSTRPKLNTVSSSSSKLSIGS